MKCFITLIEYIINPFCFHRAGPHPQSCYLTSPSPSVTLPLSPLSPLCPLITPPSIPPLLLPPLLLLHQPHHSTRNPSHLPSKYRKVSHYQSQLLLLPTASQRLESTNRCWDFWMGMIRMGNFIKHVL